MKYQKFKVASNGSNKMESIWLNVIHSRQTCGKTNGVAMSSSSRGPSQPEPSAQGSGGFCSKRSDSQLRFHLCKAPTDRLHNSDIELWSKNYFRYLQTTLRQCKWFYLPFWFTVGWHRWIWPIRRRMPRLISDKAISLTMSVRASFKMLHVAKSNTLYPFLPYICNERSKAWESRSIFDIHTTSGTVLHYILLG